MCFQEDMLERCFFVPDLGEMAAVVSCEIMDVTCNEIGQREPVVGQPGVATVSIQINLTLRLAIAPTPMATPILVTRTIAFPKRVVLCAPTGTEVVCNVRGTCICTVQPPVPMAPELESNVCCTIQLVTSVKSVADVNLLVPSFGMVMPKECKAVAVMPDVPPEDVCNGLFAPDRFRC
jgi:hypothetical protein